MSNEWIDLLPEYMDEDDVSGFITADGWIYFLHEYESSSDCAGFYKMRSDGSEMEMFHNESLEDVACTLDSVEDGWVYFTLDYYASAGVYEDTKIHFKVRTDGSERQKLVEG